MKGNAFSRSLAMMAAIASAMQAGSKWDVQQAMEAIGPYQSRGKGRGKGPFVAGRTSTNKFIPHFGAKEQARAARCYMQPSFPHANGKIPRSAPVLQQMSKQTA